MLKKKRLSQSREIMTLPDERYRSIQAARELLVDLTDPKVTPRLPRMLRLRAAHCLRHYPGDHDMKQLEHAAPHVIQQRMEPLYKMLKQHEMADSVTEDYRAAGIIPGGEEDIEARQQP
jgi:hypothetical protein